MNEIIEQINEGVFEHLQNDLQFSDQNQTNQNENLNPQQTFEDPIQSFCNYNPQIENTCQQFQNRVKNYGFKVFQCEKVPPSQNRKREISPFAIIQQDFQNQNDQNQSNLIQNLKAQDKIHYLIDNNNQNLDQSMHEIDFNQEEFELNNQLDLSKIDNQMRKKLIDLEVRLQKETLTRGMRRHLQNKRNKLKAQLRKLQSIDSDSQQIQQLKKEEQELRQIIKKNQIYKIQRNSLRNEQQIIKRQLKEIFSKQQDLKEILQIYGEYQRILEQMNNQDVQQEQMVQISQAMFVPNQNNILLPHIALNSQPQKYFVAKPLQFVSKCYTTGNASQPKESFSLKSPISQPTNIMPIQHSLLIGNNEQIQQNQKKIEIMQNLKQDQRKLLHLQCQYKSQKQLFLNPEILSVKEKQQVFKSKLATHFQNQPCNHQPINGNIPKQLNDIMEHVNNNKEKM